MIKPGLKIWIFLSSLLIAILGFLPLTESSDKDLLVHFIDVGYGDSILIEFPNGRNMLIDGGSKRNAYKVVDYFKKRKIDKIDAILITHPHPDHIGGLFKVVKKYKLDTVITYEDISASKDYASFLKMVKDKQVKFVTVRRGDQINRFGSVNIEILHPAELGGSLNDSSIVVKLVYKNVSFLFTGDIGQEICDELAEYYGKKLKSNILKAPWHGKTKSEQFVGKVKPELVIISVGSDKWPGASEEVLAEYKSLNIPVLRTDEVGSIVINTDGNEFWVSTQK